MLSLSLLRRLSRAQAKLEQAKLAAKVMNVATPGTSFSSAPAELKDSSVQTELKSMQKGLGIRYPRLHCAPADRQHPHVPLQRQWALGDTARASERAAFGALDLQHED